MPLMGNMRGPTGATGPAGSPAVKIPIGLHAANLTTSTALTTGLCHFLYVGKAPSALTTLDMMAIVATAAATITWAEVAVYKGSVVVNGNASLTRLGWTNVAATFNSTGIKKTTIALSGVVAGDDLWLCYGSSATTPFQLGGLLADRIQSGVVQTASVRPSTTASTATTLAAASLVPAWVSGKI